MSGINPTTMARMSFVPQGFIYLKLDPQNGDGKRWWNLLKFEPTGRSLGVLPLEGIKFLWDCELALKRDDYHKKEQNQPLPLLWLPFSPCDLSLSLHSHHDAIHQDVTQPQNSSPEPSWCQCNALSFQNWEINKPLFFIQYPASGIFPPRVIEKGLINQLKLGHKNKHIGLFKCKVQMYF